MTNSTNRTDVSAVFDDVTALPDDVGGLENDGFLFNSNAEYYAHVCKVYKMAMLGVVLLLLGLFGHVGNALTVLTVWPNRKSNSTSLILIVLAFCDSGVTLVWWANLGIPAICDYVMSGACVTYIRWVYPVTYLYVWPVGRWCHYAGTWVVLLVTAHRYIAVCHPHRASRLTSPRMTRYQILAIAAASAIYVLPRFCHQYLVWTPGGLQRRNTAFGASNFWFVTFYETVLYMVVIYLIPFPLLAGMTGRLIVSLRRSREKREAMTRGGREEKDLTTTFVTVVIIFMICQLPNPIRRLLVAVLPNNKRGCDSFYPYYRSVASLLLVLNSSINFVIYCFCGQRFRKTFVRRMNYLFRRKNKIGAQESSVTQNTHAQSTLKH